MNTISTKIGGFIPVIDAIVQDVGLIQAVVYGRVWRYCQMDDGICRASLQTIADNIGLSYRTVLNHIKALCAAGYLEDTTPTLRNKPHTYRDTRKVKIEGTFEAIADNGGMQEMQSAMQQVHTGMQEMQSHYAADADEETLKETIKENKTDVVFSEILEMWSSLFPNLRQPRLSTKSLRKKLGARLKDREFRDNWRMALERGSRSSFLTTVHDQWNFSLNWFLENDNNWRKVADGNYDNKRKSGKITMKVR